MGWGRREDREGRRSESAEILLREPVCCLRGGIDGVGLGEGQGSESMNTSTTSGRELHSRRGLAVEGEGGSLVDVRLVGGSSLKDVLADEVVDEKNECTIGEMVEASEKLERGESSRGGGGLMRGREEGGREEERREEDGMAPKLGAKSISV